MKSIDIENNIGKKVTINGKGDLAFNGSLKGIINNFDIDLIIIKKTKGGLVYLTDGKKFYTVRSNNVDLV